MCEFLFTFGLLFVMHASTPGRFTSQHGGIGVAMLIISASFAVGGFSGGVAEGAWGQARRVCRATGWFAQVVWYGWGRRG